MKTPLLRQQQGIAIDDERQKSESIMHNICIESSVGEVSSCRTAETTEARCSKGQGIDAVCGDTSLLPHILAGQRHVLGIVAQCVLYLLAAAMMFGISARALHVKREQHMTAIQ